jgi:hypothetical protein
VSARGIANRRHDANIVVVVAVFLLRAEGNEQRPAGIPTGLNGRCGRSQRHGGNHVLNEAGLDVDDSGPLG